MVKSYRPDIRPRRSEPHIDLVYNSLEHLLPHMNHILGPVSEPQIYLDDDSPEDWLPHIDHMLGLEGQNLIHTFNLNFLI